MLEIVQAGQAGKTKLLFEMHRFRTRVFKERMGWDVAITPDGLEVDEYDLPETVYLLDFDDEKNLVGSWRFNPTTEPTMIGDIWPKFLDSIDMPHSPDVWETSRFGVFSAKEDTKEGLAHVSKATGELLAGIFEMCLLCGIREIYSMYDMRMVRLLRRSGCNPYKTSDKIQIDDFQAQVGAFRVDTDILASIRAATGTKPGLVSRDGLPPVLQARLSANTYREDEGLDAPAIAA